MKLSDAKYWSDATRKTLSTNEKKHEGRRIWFILADELYLQNEKQNAVYVPEELVKHVEKQNKELRRFKNLTEEWIDLALLIAQTEREEAKKKA